MIDLLLAHDHTPEADAALVGALEWHTAQVLASAGQGRRAWVEQAEANVGDDPTGRIVFDPAGYATVHAAGRSWAGGRFEAPTLATLRARAADTAATTGGGRCTLWVLDGEGPATDVAALQATAPEGTLFQVASQFNTLEAPGPRVVPVAKYLSDPTQGPRAAVSAFPGALVRHYAAPSPDGGRFVQRTDGPQVELLADALPHDVARVDNGYLRTQGIADDSAFAACLAERFDQLRVGVHDGVEVALGFNWDGGVEGDRRVAQAFTSTLAGGGYSDRGITEGPLAAGCALLLRGAYLGTLLAAVALGQRAVVLTLIGGGVFGNPAPAIWDAILWAVKEVDRCAPSPLLVLVNGRTLSRTVPAARLVDAARQHGGAYLTLDRGAYYGAPLPPARIHRG